MCVCVCVRVCAGVHTHTHTHTHTQVAYMLGLLLYKSEAPAEDKRLHLDLRQQQHLQNQCRDLQVSRFLFLDFFSRFFSCGPHSNTSKIRVVTSRVYVCVCACVRACVYMHLQNQCRDLQVLEFRSLGVRG